MEYFLVILGLVIYSIIGLTLLFLTDKYILKNKQKDVIFDKRQNIKIGNKWVTLTNKEPEPIEPKYTDYELELINEIDKAYREYLNKKVELIVNDRINFIPNNTEDYECVELDNGKKFYFKLNNYELEL